MIQKINDDVESGRGDDMMASWDPRALEWPKFPLKEAETMASYVQAILRESAYQWIKHLNEIVNNIHEWNSTLVATQSLPLIRLPRSH